MMLRHLLCAVCIFIEICIGTSVVISNRGRISCHQHSFDNMVSAIHGNLLELVCNLNRTLRLALSSCADVPVTLEERLGHVSDDFSYNKNHGCPILCSRSHGETHGQEEEVGSGFC